MVDDNRLVLATLTDGLTEAGYEVIDADNGDDAILLAREHRPDLALLDIRMEGKSGFDVAAYLRDYCQIPFMLLSSFTDEDTVRQVKELGAVAYLVKPLDVGQIVPAVEAALANLPGPAAPAPAAAVSVPHSGGADEHVGPAVVLAQSVAIAVGVLMHRHSLSRHAALQSLERVARQEGRLLVEQAERMLEAVELLSRPAFGDR